MWKSTLNVLNIQHHHIFGRITLANTSEVCERSRAIENGDRDSSSAENTRCTNEWLGLT